MATWAERSDVLGASAITHSPASVQFRLPTPSPFNGRSLLDFFGRRTVAGTEQAHLPPTGTSHFTRSLRLPGGPAVVTLSSDDDNGSGVDVAATLTDPADKDALQLMLRRMCDLDADTAAIDATLSRHPAFAPLVAAHPGLRIPGGPDPNEIAIRALLGQQISLLGGVQAAARLVADHGEVLPANLVTGGIDRLFPTMDTLAAVDPELLAMPRSRGRALVTLAGALADSSVNLQSDSDPADTYRDLLTLKGIGPWTAGYILLRALRAPDVLLDSDLIVRRELERRGVTDTESLAPWRSYASLHLWQGTS